MPTRFVLSAEAFARISLVVVALWCARSIAVEIPKEDLVRIWEAAPTPAQHAKPAKPRRLLVFTLAIGYVHESTPWGAAALRAIGEKTGAYELLVSDNPEVFERSSLERFDAVCFLNTCFTPFTNSILKENLMEFVKRGKGYVGIHCSAHTFLDWAEFGDLQGAYSVNHPWHETVTVRIDEPEHPLMRSFSASSFEITDEIYQFDQRYSRQRLRVLASLDTQRTDMNKADLLREDWDFGLVWVQSFGLGRAFYSAFGHDKQVYWNPAILRHYLNGIQFALGDLPADTTPSAKLPGYKPVTKPARPIPYRTVNPESSTNYWGFSRLSFSGQSHEAVNAGTFGLGSEATVLFWMKTPEPGNDRRLLSPASGSAEQYGALRLDAGQLQVWAPTGWQPLIAAGVLSNHWVHVAVVFNSNGIATAYLNGNAVSSVPVDLKFAPVDVLIGGKFLGRWGNAYHGELLAFQLHRRPLSGLEVGRVRDETAPPEYVASPDQLSGFWHEVKKYEFSGSRAVFVQLEALVRGALTNSDGRAELESRFIELLKDPETTVAAKEYICDQLRLAGSDACVPAVAGLLTNESLSHAARRALQGLASAKARAALRGALPVASDLEAIGIINTLAALKDAEALEALQTFARHTNREISAAAIAALGEIGGSLADRSLADLWDHTPAGWQRAGIADAWMQIAEQWSLAGNPRRAQAIYEKVLRDSQESSAPRIAAGIGLLRTDAGGALERMMQWLYGLETTLRDVAAAHVYRLSTAELQTLAGRFSSLPVSSQLRIIEALAARPDPGVSLLLQATHCEHSEVRLAATAALAQASFSQQVASRLLEIAATSREADQSAARESLSRLGGVGTDVFLTNQLHTGNAVRRGEAIEAIGRRGLTNAVPLLLSAAKDESSTVRLAAVRALAQLVGVSEYLALVEVLNKATSKEERDEATRALGSAVARIRPPDSSLRQLVGRMERSSVETQTILVSLLSTVGGVVALETVQQLARNADLSLQLHAVRALAGWPDDAALPALREMIPSQTNSTCRAVALRGFIRLAGLDNKRPSTQRMADYKLAWSWSSSLDEKRLIVAALAEIPHPAVLALLENCAKEPGLAAEAGLASAKVRQAVDASRDGFLRQ